MSAEEAWSDGRTYNNAEISRAGVALRKRLSLLLVENTGVTHWRHRSL